MGKQDKKHKYHLEKGENNGWNSYYGMLKQGSTITVHDYEFLEKHCELSKKDLSLFLSKNLDSDCMASDKKKKKQCILWYGDFINRTGRMPKLKDYFDCLEIIGAY